MLRSRPGSGLDRFLLSSRSGFAYEQKFSLVNIKLKWVKDRYLDTVVAKEKDLKAVCDLKERICRQTDGCLPIYKVSKRRTQLGLDVRVSSFLRRYPTIFQEFAEGSVPWFKLTEEALCLHEEERICRAENELGLVERLCKLLMLAKERTLPLQTIEQLKWDMGLQDDYEHSLIPRYPESFELVKLPDDRVGLKLLCWDDSFAISELQRNVIGNSEKDEDLQNLAFPIKFTRGYGLKKKCMAWLGEWQRLPYTSPYVDASHLDSRTDVAEKRIVGVFHELLCLTIQKMTERKNVSNLRKPLGLPQKFTKVFGRHPGIFYISHKCATQTVVLKEAYKGHELIQKHPLVVVREKYIKMMRTGLLNRSRGLYKKAPKEEEEEEEEEEEGDEEDCTLNCDRRSSESDYSSEGISDTFLDEYSEDDICEASVCGKGTCKLSSDSNHSFPFTCECDPGWKQLVQTSSFQFFPCVVPNCTVNVNCNNVTAPPPEASNHRNQSWPHLDVCDYVYCGEGSCNKTDNGHKCVCNTGASNLLNATHLPCYRDCYLGADCALQGIGLGDASANGSSRSTPGLSDSSSNATKNQDRSSFSRDLLFLIALASILIMAPWI